MNLWKFMLVGILLSVVACKDNSTDNSQQQNKNAVMITPAHRPVQRNNKEFREIRKKARALIKAANKKGNDILREAKLKSPNEQGPLVEQAEKERTEIIERAKKEAAELIKNARTN